MNDCTDYLLLISTLDQFTLQHHILHYNFMSYRRIMMAERQQHKTQNVAT